MEIKGLMDSHRNVVARSLKNIPDDSRYHLIIDYDLSLEYLLSLSMAISFFEINEKIFPTSKKGIENVSMKLLPPFFDREGRLIPVEKVYLRIDRAGYYPANIREVLNFCKKHSPNTPLVMLGSPYRITFEEWGFPVICPGELTITAHSSLAFVYETYGNFQIPVVKK